MRKQKPTEPRVHTGVNADGGCNTCLPVLCSSCFLLRRLHLQLPPCRLVFHASESYSSLANQWSQAPVPTGTSEVPWVKCAEWRMTDTAGDHANQERTGPARHGRLQSLLQECGPAMASRFSRKARNLHFYSKLLRQDRSKKTCSPLDICLLLEGCSRHFSACFSSP